MSTELLKEMSTELLKEQYTSACNRLLSIRTSHLELEEQFSLIDKDPSYYTENPILKQYAVFRMKRDDLKSCIDTCEHAYNRPGSGEKKRKYIE